MTLQETYKYLAESVNTNTANASLDSLGADKSIKNYAFILEFRKELKDRLYDFEEKYYSIVFKEDDPEKWHGLKENNLPTDEEKIPEDILRGIWSYGGFRGYDSGTKTYLYFKRYLFFRTNCDFDVDKAYSFAHKITVADYKFLTKAGMTPHEIAENINGKINRNIFNIFKSYGCDLETCLTKACYFKLDEKDNAQVKDLINLLKYLGMDKKDALNRVISKSGYYQYFDFDPSLPPKQKEGKYMYYGDSSENKHANFYLMLKNLMEWRKEEQSGKSNTYIINQGKFENTIPNPRAKGNHYVNISAFTGKTDYIKDTIFGSPDGYGKKVKLKEYKSIKSAWKDFIRLYYIEEKFHFKEHCYIMKYNKGE